MRLSNLTSQEAPPTLPPTTCSKILAFFRRISSSRDQTIEEISKWNVIALLLFPCQCKNCKLQTVRVRQPAILPAEDSGRSSGRWTDANYARTFTTLHLERLCVNTDFLLNTSFSDLEAVLDLSPALLQAPLWTALNESPSVSGTFESAARNDDVNAVEDRRARPLLPIDSPIELLQKMAHLEKCKAMLNPETSTLPKTIKDVISTRRGIHASRRLSIERRNLLRPSRLSWDASPGIDKAIDVPTTPRGSVAPVSTLALSMLADRNFQGPLETDAERSPSARRRMSDNVSMRCRRLSPVIPDGLSAIVQQSRYDRVLLCPTPTITSRPTEVHLRVPVSATSQQRRSSTPYTSSLSFEQAASDTGVPVACDRPGKRGRTTKEASGVRTRVTASTSPPSGDSDFSSSASVGGSAFAGRGARGEPYASRRHNWWNSHTHFIYVYLLSVLDVQHTIIVPMLLIKRKSLALPAIYCLVKLLLKTPLDIFLLSLHQMLQQGLCGTLNALHPRLRVFGLLFCFILPLVHIALETHSEFEIVTSSRSVAFYTARLLPPSCDEACSQTSYVDSRDGCASKSLFCWQAPPSPPGAYAIAVCGAAKPYPNGQIVTVASLCDRVSYRSFCMPREFDAADQYLSGCVPNMDAWTYSESRAALPEGVVYALFASAALAPLFFSFFYQKSDKLKLGLFILGLGSCALSVASMLHGVVLNVSDVYSFYASQTKARDWLSISNWIEALVLTVCSIATRLPIQGRIASLNPPYFHAGRLATGIALVDAGTLILSLIVLWVLQYGMAVLNTQYAAFDDAPNVTFDMQYPRLWPMVLDNLDYARVMMWLTVVSVWVMALGWKMSIVENVVTHIRQLKAFNGTPTRVVVVVVIILMSIILGWRLEGVIVLDHWLGARGVLAQWGVILFVIMLIILPCHNIQMRWGSRRAKGWLYLSVFSALVATTHLCFPAIGLAATFFLLAALTAIQKMGRHINQGGATAQLDRLARVMSVHSPTHCANRGRRVSYAPSVLPISDSSIKIRTEPDASLSRDSMTCEVSEVSDLCTIDVSLHPDSRKVNIRFGSCVRPDRKPTQVEKVRLWWSDIRLTSIALPIRLLLLGGTEIMRVSLQHMFETSLDESSPLGLFLVPTPAKDKDGLTLTRSRSAFPSRESCYRRSPSRFIDGPTSRMTDEVEVDKRTWKPESPRSFSSPFNYYDWPLTRRNRAQLKPLQDSTRTSWRTGASSLGIWWSYAMRFLLFPSVVILAGWHIRALSWRDEQTLKPLPLDALAGRPINYGSWQLHLPRRVDLWAFLVSLGSMCLCIVFPKLLSFFVPPTRRVLAIVTETVDEPPRFESARRQHPLSGFVRAFQHRPLARDQSG